MRTIILTSLLLILLNCFGKTQSLKPKQDLYFLLNPKAYYILKYKKIGYPTKFDLEITFNTPCLMLKQMPNFYKYKDSVSIISKSRFVKKDYNFLSYDKFKDIVCKEGNNASLIVKYNIYFIEKTGKDKYLLYKVLYITPTPDDRKDNIVVKDSASNHK